MNISKNFYYFSNFLEFYQQRISSKLCDIDIFVKTSEGHMDISDISNLLQISEVEILDIMSSNNIQYIDSNNFFNVMENGSSYICNLFSREKECESPYIYTREQISYIYELDIKLINNICDKLSIIKITNHTLPLIFAEICLENV